MTAYKNLWLLKKKGLIQTRCDHKSQKFVWTLTDKGFQTIKSEQPLLKNEGYKSENIEHDIYVNALHLGEWLLGLPKGVGLFSEQQLRTYYFDHYPTWVPRSEIHRADGFLSIPISGDRKTIALEVELTQKRNIDYEIVGDFYAKQEMVYRVLWLVSRESLANRIHQEITKSIRNKPMIHNFVTVPQFKKLGWQAPIELGPDSGKTIAVFLANDLTEENSSCKEKGSDSCPTLFLLDTRKCPTNLNVCGISNLSQFRD